jgi:hypothetical protein
MRVITIQALRQHVFDLWGKADGIEWAEPGFDAVADHSTGTIRLHPITSEVAYAVALHEIGHIRRGRQDDVLVNERAAWEWGRENALVWTPTMERAAERSLGDYELYELGNAPTDEDLKAYYYKQIYAFVDDLLVGFKPDGLEVIDALIRNAVELAELYKGVTEEDLRSMLLRFVDMAEEDDHESKLN